MRTASLRTLEATEQAESRTPSMEGPVCNSKDAERKACMESKLQHQESWDWENEYQPEMGHLGAHTGM